jgi:hypothetical protein
MDANSTADVIAVAKFKAADVVAMSGFKEAAGCGAMRRSVHKSKVVADSGAGAVPSMAVADSGAVACLLAVTSTEATKNRAGRFAPASGSCGWRSGSPANLEIGRCTCQAKVS